MKILPIYTVIFLNFKAQMYHRVSGYGIVHIQLFYSDPFKNFSLSCQHTCWALEQDLYTTSALLFQIVGSHPV